MEGSDGRAMVFFAHATAADGRQPFFFADLNSVKAWHYDIFCLFTFYCCSDDLNVKDRGSSTI